MPRRLKPCDFGPDGDVWECFRCGERVARRVMRACPADLLPCDLRGNPTGRTVNHKPCADKPCRRNRQLPVLRCERHRLCTVERSAEADTGLVRWCDECQDRIG
jgi:hypothetical protein